MEKIRKPVVLHDTKTLCLSYNTAKQLNIVSTESCPTSLIQVLDHCKTAIGKRRFRDRLLHPKIDKEYLEKEYDYNDFFLTESRYLKVNSILTNISDLERQFRRILVKTLNPSEFVVIKKSLNNFIDVSRHCHGIPWNMDNLLVSELVRQVEKIDQDACSRYNIDSISSNIFSKGLYTDIDELQSEHDECVEAFSHICKELNLQTENSSGSYFKVDSTDKDFIHIVITKKRYDVFSKNAKNIKYKNDKIDIKHIVATKISSSSTSVRLTHPLFQTFNERIMELKTILKKRVTEEYVRYLDSYTRFKYLFQEIIEYIGTVDYHCTNAYNATKFAYTRPRIVDEGGQKSYVRASQLRHPIVERIQLNTAYVANDVTLGTPGNDGLLLFGINSAGKSSLVKSIGLSVIMASAGMYVPCESFTFYPYKQIFTRIPSGDNIGRGQSTFTNEIGELRNIIKRADGNSLVIGDELCCGTEQVSAMSIVSAGIITLCARKTTFIFASHLHDLVNIEQVKRTRNLTVKHLSVAYDEHSGRLLYDRILKDGPGTTVYGLEVCKALDMDKNFLDLAYGIRRQLIDIPDTILSTRKNRYNARLYRDVCAICKKTSSDVHHIQEQHTADTNGLVGHIHKNALHNLVSVCKECHDAIHDGVVEINGYFQTSNGVELMFDNKK